MSDRDFIGALIKELNQQLSVRTVGQFPTSDVVVDEPVLVVERAGGSSDLKGVKDNPIIQVDVWGGSKKKSYDLACKARAVLLNLPPRFRGFFIYRTQEVSGVVYAPATASRAYRHRINVAYTVRGMV